MTETKKMQHILYLFTYIIVTMRAWVIFPTSRHRPRDCSRTAVSELASVARPQCIVYISCRRAVCFGDWFEVACRCATERNTGQKVALSQQAALTSERFDADSTRRALLTRGGVVHRDELSYHNRND